MGSNPSTVQNTSQNGTQTGQQTGQQTGTQSGLQNTSTQSSPWAPALPAITSLLSGIGSLPTGVTPGQSGAIASLTGAAGAIPNFAPQAGTTANSLFGGGGASTYAPMQLDAYNNINASLAPLTNPANLNPMNTPGFSDALRTMGSDVTNQVNDQFAAAGRDLSPGNSTALARGLSQGEGGLIANQYNANAGNLTNAANTVYNAGSGTAGALTGFNQLGNTNALAGASLAGSIPGLALAPGQAQLGAANAGYNLPYGNFGSAESLLTPLAALGSSGSSTGSTSGTNSADSFGTSTGTSTGTGQTTSQTQVPLWQQILGGVMGGAGAAGSLFGAPAGGTSAASGIGSIGSSALSGIRSMLEPLAIFSDERIKENKERVGALHDGTPVWSYNYIGDPVPRIGLMAQEVERTRPDAVTTVGGIKAVDYGRATQRARAIGGLLDGLASLKKVA